MKLKLKSNLIRTEDQKHFFDTFWKKQYVTPVIIQSLAKNSLLSTEEQNFSKLESNASWDFMQIHAWCQMVFSVDSVVP